MTSRAKTNLIALDFTSEIERLIRDFTGREWLRDGVDSWVKREKERFFILTGEPGVGKSAFAAWLTRTRKDIVAYNFCLAGRNDTIVPNTVLRSLGAQLGHALPDYGQALANTIEPEKVSINVKIDVEKMTGGEITGVIINHLHASEPKEVLDIILRAPFAALPEIANPAIILIDSLDEAVTYRKDTNLVTLLSGLDDLPAWVRIICTSRPERTVLCYFDGLSPRILAAESKMNVEDVEQYITKRVRKKAMQVSIKSRGKDPKDLLKRLKDLHKGNFLFAKVLLDDVESGRQPLVDLSALPSSIDEIYHGFLRRFKAQWEHRYQPILGVLAVAREPVSETQLANFTGIRRTTMRQSLGEIIQFLDEHGDGGTRKTYALYHQSFRDYLLDGERNVDFWCAPEDGHRGISDHYLKKCSEQWSACDDYGLNHLAHHLLECRDYSCLHNLISQDWMKMRCDGQGPQGFLQDVELAWQAALVSAEDENVASLVKLVRLKTVKELVAMRAYFSYSEKALYALTRLGDVSTASDMARMVASPLERLRALVSVDLALSSEARVTANLHREILGLAQSLGGGPTRGEALAFVAECMSATGRFDEAEEALSSIRNTDCSDERKQVAMVEVGSAMARAGLTRRIDGLVSTLGKKSSDYALVLAHIANDTVRSNLSVAKKLSNESISAARSLADRIAKARVLALNATSMVRLNKPKARELIAEAEKYLREGAAKFGGTLRMEATLQIGVALAKLGEIHRLIGLSHLVEEGEQSLFRTVLPKVLAADGAPDAALHFLGDAELDPEMLILFGEKLGTVDDGKAEALLQKALDITKSLPSQERERDEHLHELARVWANRGDFHRALTVADLLDRYDRMSVLSLIATAMARHELPQDAVRVAESIESREERAGTLADIAAVLADTDRALAADLLDRAVNLGLRSSAWGRLATLTLGPMAHAAARTGHVDLALSLARSIPDNRHCGDLRMRTLAIVAETLAEDGRRPDAERAMAELAQVSGCASSRFYREQVVRVQIAMTRHGDLVAASQAWDAICRDKGLGRMSWWLAPCARKDSGTTNLIRKLVAAGQLQTAANYAREAKDPADWEAGITLVACGMVTCGRTEEAVRLIEEARLPKPAFMWGPPDPLPATSLAAFIDCLIKAGQLEAALLLVPMDGHLDRLGPSWAKLGMALRKRGDPRADKLFDKASAAMLIYELLDEFEGRRHSEEYAAIVACLMSVADSRGQAFLESAHQAKKPALVLALAQLGLWDDAVKVAASLPNAFDEKDIERGTTKKDVLAKLAPYVVMVTGEETARLQAFLSLLSPMREPTAPWCPLFELSLAMARSGKLKTAIEIHPAFSGTVPRSEEKPYCFVQSVSLLAPYVENACPGFTISALREIAEIGTWMYPDWRSVHDLMMKAE